MSTKPLQILDIGDESIDWTNVLPLSHYIAKRLKRRSLYDTWDDYNQTQECELLDRARQAFAYQLAKARVSQKKGDS